jgi:integrase
MNKYSRFSRNLSQDYLIKIAENDVFDGIDNRPPPSIIKDTSSDSRGLILRLSKNGRMTFVVHGRIASKKSTAQYFTIGNAREIRLKIARKRAGEFKEWMNSGKNPTDERKALTFKITLIEIFEDYLKARGTKTSENIEGLKVETVAEYKNHFNRLSKRLTNKDARRITQEDIINEHNRIAQKHTPFMSDKSLSFVKSLFNYARGKYINNITNEEHIKSNPTEILVKDKLWKVNGGQSRRKRECIDTEDLPCLLDAIEEIEHYKDGIKHIHTVSRSCIVASHFFKFMLFTGWRPEEVVEIEWVQVSVDCREITWDDRQAAIKLKGIEPFYRFPLNEEATKVLLNLKNYGYNEKWVFPNNSQKPYNNKKQGAGHFKQNPTQYINLLQKLVANDKRYTAGIYRKTFQTYAEECGLFSSTIKRLVFHTQKHSDVQSGYIASKREWLRKQSQKVADYILIHSGRIEEKASTNIEIDNIYVEKAKLISEKKNIEFDEVIRKWLEIGAKLEQLEINI